MVDNVASVTVQFVSLQTRLVTDKNGVVLEDESNQGVKSPISGCLKEIPPLLIQIGNWWKPVLRMKIKP